MTSVRRTWPRPAGALSPAESEPLNCARRFQKHSSMDLAHLEIFFFWWLSPPSLFPSAPLSSSLSTAAPYLATHSPSFFSKLAFLDAVIMETMDRRESAVLARCFSSSHSRSFKRYGAFSGFSTTRPSKRKLLSSSLLCCCYCMLLSNCAIACLLAIDFCVLLLFLCPLHCRALV
jgi:hypothetical protein